jgi:toxin ParE1/3/4
MTNTRTPLWRPKAWEDVEAEAVSLGIAGLTFIDKVDETIQLLCEHPELGSVFNTSNPRLVEIRAKLVIGFRRFVVFYQKDKEVIEIIRVLRGGRDMQATIETEG